MRNGDSQAPFSTATSVVNLAMTKKFPLHPANPERICWGCDLYCAADSMKCGSDSERTPHPFELFGENWHDWGQDFAPEPDEPSKPAVR